MSKVDNTVPDGSRDADAHLMPPNDVGGSGVGSEEYRVWSIDMPFRKDGAPVPGTMGSTIRRVLVIEADTFRRLIDEHPSLRTARFNVGEFGP